MTVSNASILKYLTLHVLEANTLSGENRFILIGKKFSHLEKF